MKAVVIIVVGVLVGSAAGMIMLPKQDSAASPAQSALSSVNVAPAQVETGEPVSDETATTAETEELPRIISTSTILGRSPPTKAPPLVRSAGNSPRSSPSYPITLPRSRAPAGRC